MPETPQQNGDQRGRMTRQLQQGQGGNMLRGGVRLLMRRPVVTTILAFDTNNPGRARGEATVSLGVDACQRMDAARAVVDATVAAGDNAPPVYGVNTGFGALAEVRISAREVAQLQINLVRSHAAGIARRCRATPPAP